MLMHFDLQQYSVLLVSDHSSVLRW